MFPDQDKHSLSCVGLFLCKPSGHLQAVSVLPGLGAETLDTVSKITPSRESRFFSVDNILKGRALDMEYDGSRMSAEKRPGRSKLMFSNLSNVSL